MPLLQTWNREEHARQLLVDRQDQSVDKDRVSATLTQQLLFEALHRNNVLFVNLLMDYGASIEALTEEQLIIVCVKTMVDELVDVLRVPRACFQNDKALPLPHLSIDPNFGKHDIDIQQLKELIERRYHGYLLEYLGDYVSSDQHGRGRFVTRFL